MADDLDVLCEILTIGKHICEEVRRNIFAADRETAERLRNNCAQLIVAIVVSTRRLPINDQDRSIIDEHVYLLIQEIQKYTLLFEERFAEKEKCDSMYSCPTVSGGRQGRPKFVIPCEQLEGLRSLGFSWTAIAGMLGVSEKTVKRRREEYNISEQIVLFSDISDDELDCHVRHVLEVSQNSGERMMMGWFRGRGIRIQRWRLRQAISRVDPIGRELRKRTITKRRVYSVPTPNALWHLDGHHKLIRWRIVIHGAIDGYSRTVVFLSASTNNRASTVLDLFSAATQVFHHPRRIRTDYGTENIAVAREMLNRYGVESKPVLTGQSVHNQRIERLWLDVHTFIVSHFKNIFYYLESVQLLDPNSETDIYALHYVYIPMINRAVDQFILQWNNHPISGQRGSSPLQLWTEGFYKFAQSDYISVREVLDPKDIDSDYGVDDDAPLPEIQTVNHVEVPESEIELTQCEITTLLNTVNPAIADNKHGIESYQKTKTALLDIISNR